MKNVLVSQNYFYHLANDHSKLHVIYYPTPGSMLSVARPAPLPPTARRLHVQLECAL